MKQNRIFIVAALLGTLAFASCKKDYTCTCTTVVATGSGTQTHNISNETYNQAKRECNNYEDQANSSLPGGTTCHL